MAQENNKRAFQGKWNHIRNECFEDFLRENGANYLIRKMASHSNPTLDITQEGETFTFVLHSMFTTRNFKFTVGETYEETQHNGTIMQVTPSWDEDKLVLTYEPKEADKGKAQKHIREVTGDDLVMTMKVGEVTAKRFFKRIP